MTMTEDEARAHLRGVLTDAQIAAHPERDTIAAIYADPRFAPLRATFDAGEGNLLETTEADTVIQQIATIRWAIDTYAPVLFSVAEVGFHKGYFFLLLSHLRPLVAFDHFACDIRPESYYAAKILGERVRFTAGDSRIVWADVLEQVGGSADLAWIDGGHEGTILAHDLGMAMEYGARLILVDDAVWLPKLAGVISDCCNVYGYARVTPPTPEDRRGIAVLVRS